MATFAGLSCLVLAVLAQCSTTWAQSYCSVCSDHTMCKYPSSALGSSCGNVDTANSGVSYADQQEILKAHNDLRRKVQNGDFSDRGLPAAKYIPDLTWNTELAEIAQRWANQCREDQYHDKCRNRLNGGSVGQNVHQSGGRAKNWTAVLMGDKGWFSDELEKVPPSSTGLQYAWQIGHLTQILWEKTTEIGCGYVKKQVPSEIYGSVMDTFSVCNYGPAGNDPSQLAYELKYN